MEEKWDKIRIDGEETKYSVSYDGRVRNDVTNRIMHQSTDKKGYKRINIRHNGKSMTLKVHRLVKSSFYKYIIKGTLQNQINHKDNNPGHNEYDNLEWCSNDENAAHRKETGRYALQAHKHQGVNNVLSKYTERQIHNVCKLLEEGCDPMDIYEHTDVSLHVIYKIKTKVLWKHVSRQYNIPDHRPKQVYSDELRYQVIELIEQGHHNKSILKILNLDNTDSHISFINNVRYKWMNKA